MSPYTPKSRATLIAFLGNICDHCGRKLQPEYQSAGLPERTGYGCTVDCCQLHDGPPNIPDSALRVAVRDALDALDKQIRFQRAECERLIREGQSGEDGLQLLAEWEGIVR